MFLMFVLTLTDGLFSLFVLYTPSCVNAVVQRETSSIDWTQLIRLLGARPHVSSFLMFFMFVFTLTNGLFCLFVLYTSSCVGPVVQRETIRLIPTE
jgi:hypothetical protein